MKKYPSKTAAVCGWIERTHISTGQITRKEELARCLFLTLPYGAVSKYALDLIAGDKHTKYYLSKEKMLVKKSVYQSLDGKQKQIIYYQITAKGLNYIKRNMNLIPEWLRNLSDLKIVTCRESGKANELQRSLHFQDSIVFFTMAGYKTLLTEMWHSTLYGTIAINGLANSVVENIRFNMSRCIAESLSEINKRNTENCESKSLYNSIIGGSLNEKRKVYFGDSDRIAFATTKELKYCFDVDPGSTESKTFVDTAIGILGGTIQDMPVYMTYRHGMNYYTGYTKGAITKNAQRALMTSNNKNRGYTKRCVSAIVLYRSETELVRAILDVYGIRKKENKFILNVYDHVYLIEMSRRGIRQLSVVETLDPANLAETAKEEKTYIASILSEANLSNSGKLIINNTVASVVMDLDLAEIYEIMKRSEERNQRETIVCETWQANIFTALNEEWGKHPLLENTAKYTVPQYGFNVISVEVPYSGEIEVWNPEFRTI